MAFVTGAQETPLVVQPNFTPSPSTHSPVTTAAASPGVVPDMVRFHHVPDEWEDKAYDSESQAVEMQQVHSNGNGVGLTKRMHSSRQPSHPSQTHALQRGRSYSSAPDAGAMKSKGPFKPDDCFDDEFLSEPLLQDRGASSETAQHLFGTPPPRLSLEWKNIDLSVPMPTPTDKKAKKKILLNVSGRAYCGEMLAVMGPSGSGKTTLISMLSGGWRRVKESGDLTGSILVNGKPPSKRMSRFLALIAQDDLLFANLTVEQTLKYAALLNLPKELSREEKLDRVEKVIQVLGLQKCRTTKIGGAFERGVSGGERKRCSVANELLMNPSIILADEPTSGLDSTTAARLISTFRSLARGGRAVVCSIHQPSSQIFDLFDKVMLLAQGRTIFYGSTQSVQKYFDSTGLMCKPYYNRADFLLEVVSDLTHENIEEAERAEKKSATAAHSDTAADATNNGHAQRQSADAESSSSAHGNPVKALRQHNSSLQKQRDAGTTSPKDGIDLERGIAADLLKDTLPDRSFDVAQGQGQGKGGSSEELERTVRRLPLLWAQHGDAVLELERKAREKQIKESEEAIVQSNKEGGGKGGGGAGGGSTVLTISASEKALADESLNEEADNSSRWPLTWWEQMVLLLSRSFVQHKGERITKLYAAQVLGIGLVVSLVWFQTEREVSTLMEQTGSLFFITIFWSFTPLFNSLTTFPAERAIIMKERKSSMYRLSAYFTAKMLAEAPVELIYPVLFLCLAYFMVGFHYAADSFFYTVLTILLSTLCAQSYGLLISCVLLDFKQSITFASVSMLTLMLLSGFYVKLEKIPVWLRWLSYACFPKYSYNILAFIQFEPFTFPCSGDEQGGGGGSSNGVSFSSCPVPGPEVMSAYDFDLLPLYADIIILFGLTILFRLAAYAALYKTTAP